MKNLRLIPALQVYKGKLVKSKKFVEPIYVGDPTNVISIFNELDVDEIFINQITLNSKVDEIDYNLLEKISSQSITPLTYGGGIYDLKSSKRIIELGFEKIVLSSCLQKQPEAIQEMISVLGSQAIVISLDIRKNNDHYEVTYLGGSTNSKHSLDENLELIKKLNPGEVLLSNISLDGTRRGYDLELIKKVKSILNQPLISLGGAGSREDLADAIRVGGADASAASSIFIFKSDRTNQLINYPNFQEKKKLLPELNNYLDVSQAYSPGNFVLVDNLWKNSSSLKYCNRCIISNQVPGSGLESLDTCNYCALHDKLDNEYPNDFNGQKRFNEYIKMLKKEGLGRPYDCILGVSGGADSSYLAHVLVENNVRVLAVHFDNTWNSPIATSNIYNMTTKLNIDLETYVVDNNEYDDIYRSFLKSGVKDLEAPTDIGFISVLYRAAEKHKVKHIVEGHSFRTEGVSPLGWLYMDGGYIKSVHKQFGKMKMVTYPNMSFLKFIKWTTFGNLKRSRPLYWLDYSKNEARKLLSSKYGWQWYGGHHLENRFTAFYHSYFLPLRFGIDFRQIEFSALIRSGFLSRELALEEFMAPRKISSVLLNIVKQRLDFSESEFENLMQMPASDYTKFKTYKKYFRILKPFFFLMLKFDRIPLSFYEKFCK